MFGLSGTVLRWMKSYLVGRFQRVHLRQRKSEAEPVRWGVPQGSVLGPLLFSLYLTPLGDIIRSHDINFHMYADDIQLYLSTDSSQFASARSSLERCILDVRAWMSANILKLNDSKTEFLVLGRKLHLETTSNSCLIIGNKVIHASPKVRNLGTILILHLVWTLIYHLYAEALIFTFGICPLLENIYIRKPSSLLCMQPSLPELTIVIVYCMESLINILKKYKCSKILLLVL